MKHTELSQFCQTVFEDLDLTKTRKGQHMMNKFGKQFPDIEVPQEVDCFYDDNKINKFYDFLWGLAAS